MNFIKYIGLLALVILMGACKKEKVVTLVYGAKEERYNDAVVLKEVFGSWEFVNM